MPWDEVWESLFRECEWGKYPSEPLIRFVARNFYQASDRSQVRLLEVGCGPGANLWYMAREGFSVYGIDGSRTAVDRAYDRLNRECPGWHGELVRGDFATLPFPGDFFDGVIDHEAVYCCSFDVSRRVYAEIWRTLKPGGKLFSRTFATGCVGEGTGEPCGHNAWRASVGPLAGKGVSRFTNSDEIESLFDPLLITSLELHTYTIDKRRAEVREWMIEASKSK
jgi:Methylase involved in ubiquinone/menaquinone biosynthesis